MGRRDAVEVPRRRLGRAVGRAGRRRRRDPGVREPTLRPGRARAPARRRQRRRGRSRRSPRPTRDASTASSASSTRHGGSATFTGDECFDWAGGQTGPCFAAQGNILVGEETVAALATTFTATAGRPLAQRLLECLAAAQAAGGDRRGQQSAALLVVERDGGYAGAERRPGRPARRRPRAAGRGARAALRHPRPALRQDTPRGLGRRRRRAAAPSSASGSAGSATTATSRRRSTRGRAPRTSRSGSTASSSIDPVVLRELRAR